MSVRDAKQTSTRSCLLFHMIDAQKSALPADGQGMASLRWETLNQGLNPVIYPDYSLPCLSQFCIAVRTCSQSEKYKALLVHLFMELADL